MGVREDRAEESAGYMGGWKICVNTFSDPTLAMPVNMSTSWVTHLSFTATTDDTFTRGCNSYRSDAFTVCVVDLIDETPSLWRECSDFSVIPALTHKELPAVSVSIADEHYHFTCVTVN